MKCRRCLKDAEATCRVYTDVIDMKVCSACADEARRLGIAVEALGLTPSEQKLRRWRTNTDGPNGDGHESTMLLRHVRNANSINKTAPPMLTHCLGSKPKALPKLTATTL